jgi:hypothetical protein
MGLVAAALYYLLISGTGIWRSAPIHARVVDAVTAQPLAGAIVVANWQLSGLCAAIQVKMLALPTFATQTPWWDVLELPAGPWRSILSPLDPGMIRGVVSPRKSTIKSAQGWHR